MKLKISVLKEDFIDVDVNKLVDCIIAEDGNETYRDCIDDFSDNIEYYLEDKLGIDLESGELFYGDEEDLVNAVDEELKKRKLNETD